MKSLVIKGSLLLSLCSFSTATLHKEVPSLAKRDSKEFNCLVEVLTFESLNQPIKGQKAVLDVIHNRKNSKGFPNTYCDVVHQKYAFSYRNSLKPGVPYTYSFKNPIDIKATKRIENLVDFFLNGEYNPVLGPNVLWYAKVNLQTKWMSKMDIEVIIKDHKFLKISRGINNGKKT